MKKNSKIQAVVGFSINPETTWDVEREEGERTIATFDTHLSRTSFDVALALKACEVEPFLIGAVGPNTEGSSMINAQIAQGLKDSEIRNKLITCRTISGLATIVPKKEIRLGYKGPITRSIHSEAVDLIKRLKPKYAIATGIADSEEEISSLRGLFSSPITNVLVPGYGLTKNSDLMLEALFLSSILIMNEHEAASCLGLRRNQLNTKSIQVLLKYVGLVVVTMGKNGLIAVSQNGSSIEIPALKIKAVDETGSGDCFVGFFIGAMSRNYCLFESLNIANIAGGLKASRYGTTNIPTWDEVIALA